MPFSLKGNIQSKLSADELKCVLLTQKGGGGGNANKLGVSFTSSSSSSWFDSIF